MSKQRKAKDTRRAIRAHAADIKQGMVTEILTILYSLPLPQRLKWAWRVAVGIRRESLWALKAVWTTDWLLERLTIWIGDLLWPQGTCGDCANGFEGTCTECAGDNYGHTTEIASNATCANWKRV